MLQACAKKPTENINFDAVLDGTAVDCGKEIETANGQLIQINDFRFFVHDIVITGADGKAFPFILSEEKLQTQGVALLDFEDGCHNGSLGTNKALNGITKAQKPWKKIAFKIGVPFALNHENPLKAEGPLTTTSMHWSWQGGYKFMRIDGKLDNESFRFHLGSTGCQGELNNIKSCKALNVGHLEFALTNQSTSIDLALLIPKKLHSGGCMSHGGNDCTDFFKTLGIIADHESI